LNIKKNGIICFWIVSRCGGSDDSSSSATTMSSWFGITSIARAWLEFYFWTGGDLDFHWISSDFPCFKKCETRKTTRIIASTH
jgi:hypothetical protein